jgi:hypothetical protein
MTYYAIECDCHGTRLYKTMRERDAHAITYQCGPKLFRLTARELHSKQQGVDNK